MDRQRGDDQRPVVLPRAVGARAEEGVELLAEGVRERVDVDFGADVVEGDLKGAWTYILASFSAVIIKY